MAPEDAGGSEDAPIDPATGAPDSSEPNRGASARDHLDDSRDIPAGQESSETRESSGTGGSSEAGGREVEVPMRVFKTVTVFSTLFAVVFVLAGFLLLDRATDRATASLSEVDPALAILGLLGIVAGAAVYAFGTRFRAAGMGTPKDRPDEASDDE